MAIDFFTLSNYTFQAWRASCTVVLAGSVTGITTSLQLNLGLARFFALLFRKKRDRPSEHY